MTYLAIAGGIVFAYLLVGWWIWRTRVRPEIVVWMGRGPRAVDKVDAALFFAEGVDTRAFQLSRRWARRWLAALVVSLWPLYLVVWNAPRCDPQQSGNGPVDPAGRGTP